MIEINLENIHEEGELTSQLAYALEVELNPRRPWDTLRGALSGRWLVLLDSAEGLTPQAIERLGEPLLGRLEELHLLVTSRASLHLVKYEQPVEVEQLLVGRGEWIGPAERMFIAYTPQRRQVEVVREHFETVRNICRELDGYPLGILLEAAQLSDERETPERLLDGLRANMVEALRYSRAAGLPDRHRSVGAAMKSSHDKLGAAAKQLLAHVAVFPGGAKEALRIFRELGDRYEGAKVLTNLGSAYAQQGNWTRAIECYEQALAIRKKLKDRQGQAKTLINLGAVYASQGGWEQAIQHFKKGLRIFRELGERQGEGMALTDVGIAYEKQGCYGKALASCQASLAIFQDIGDVPSYVLALSQLAVIHLRLDEMGPCFDHLAQVLSLALKIHPKLVRDTISYIVDIAKELAGEGRFSDVATLGSGLFERVMEMEKEEWRSEELEAVGVLAQRVCAVIALAGKSRLEGVSEGGEGGGWGDSAGDGEDGR